MSVNWSNPYKRKGRFWLKGNLHTHTNLSGCGRIPPDQVLKIYEKMGYSYLAITDHQQISNPNAYKTKLVLLAGLEADFSGGRHTGIVHPRFEAIKFKPSTPQQKLISDNAKRGCLTILNHPDWQPIPHYSIEQLLETKDYHGIEIYNIVIERLEGTPLATGKWDKLLSRGKRVLGFANQDSHDTPDYQDCCNVVRAKRKQARDIFEALMDGNFYCYYGVTILDVGRERDSVFVRTKNAKLIRFVGREGIILKKVKAASASLSFKDYPDTPYIRIECLGAGEEISWSQPFYR